MINYVKLNKYNNRIPNDVDKNVYDACKRIIWYIIERDWGIVASIRRASKVYNVPQDNLKKLIRDIFPKDYFINACKRRNALFIRKISKTNV